MVDEAGGGLFGQAAIVGQAVGHHQASGVHDHVVARYLVKGFLRNGHMRRFIFHDHQRLGGSGAPHQSVAAAQPSVETKTHLVGCECRRIAQVSDQMGHSVLAHPLFGCEHKPFAAQRVKYGGLARGVAAQSERPRRQI